MSVEIQKLTAELNQIKLGKNSINNNQNFQMNNNNNTEDIESDYVHPGIISPLVSPSVSGIIVPINDPINSPSLIIHESPPTHSP